MVTSLSAHPRSCKPAQGPLVPDRRRGRGLRREWARGVRAASSQARRPPRVLVCLRPARAERCTDLRRKPIETRKATLASVLRGCLPGLRLNEHLACPSCFRRTASTAHSARSHVLKFDRLVRGEAPLRGPRFSAAARNRRLGRRRPRGGCGIFRATIIGALDVLGFSLFGWGIFPTPVRHWRRGGGR